MRDTFIYAADKFGGLWLNTTGIGSNSKPVLSQNVIGFTTSLCSQEEQSITFTLFDSCSNKQAKLLDVGISGSPNFVIARGGEARVIKPDDSLVIRYTPSGSSDDTASIRLRFKLGWKEFDTTVTVTGKPSLSREAILASIKPDTIIASNCANVQGDIHFTIRDTCLKQYARLEDIMLSGSSAFQLSSGQQIPRQTGDSNAVSVEFTPENLGTDSVQVTLRFSFEGISFDTIVTLIGIYQPTRSAMQPMLSDTLLAASSSDCDSTAAVLFFSYSDSCLNQNAVLVSASITSTNFVVSDNLPASDSIAVVYTGSGIERAPMLLRFDIGGYMFDTTIYLLGSSIGNPDSLGLIVSLTANNVAAGQLTEYLVHPSKVVSGKNLSEISFDVTLDEDLLEVVNVSIPIGLALSRTQAQQANGVVTHHITISGTDIALDPGSAILSIELLTYITDTISTPIAFSNVKLNSFDPDYERCTLSATSQDTTFTLALLCGDRTLTDFLRHGRSALEITSIQPNPAQDEIRINFKASGNDPVSVDVLNTLGQLVGRVSGSNQSAVFSVKDYMSGLYMVTVRQGSESASAQFVVNR